MPEPVSPTMRGCSFLPVPFLCRSEVCRLLILCARAHGGCHLGKIQILCGLVCTCVRPRGCWTTHADLRVTVGAVPHEQSRDVIPLPIQVAADFFPVQAVR